MEAGGLLGEKKREVTHKEKRRDVRRFSLARLRRTTLLLYWLHFQMRLLGMLSPNSSSRLFLRLPSLVFHCSSNIYDPTCSIYFFASLRILWRFRRSFSHGAIFQETLPGAFIFLRHDVRTTFTRRYGMDDSRRLRTKFQRVSVHFHLSFVCVSV